MPSQSPTFAALKELSGYQHPAYAAALSAWGEPRQLSGCQGWVLKRRVPGTERFDGMGCYPLFSCPDWTRLPGDLMALEGELVSISLVLDPFGDYRVEELRACFPDRFIPFKQHFVVDLSQPPGTSTSAHHRRNARRALRELRVELAGEPAGLIEEWMVLYENLIDRHGIRGLLGFSRTSFERQLRVPGLVAFRAMHAETTLGILLWYVQGSIAYYHLGAFSDQGYRLQASFALFWTAIEHFAGQHLQWLDLGAGAGVGEGGPDGLSRFKQGWSSLTRPAYFCGRVLDHEAYARILRDRNLTPTQYFPAYREGEFA